MKMKGVAMESSSPSQHHNMFEDQSRSRKFQSLMQDYTDLFKETEEKRKKINLAKRRRYILSAEVRFLRQRYEELMKYKSGEQQVVTIQEPYSYREALPFERKGRQVREINLPVATPVLDLNQIANDEEEELQGQEAFEPARMMPVKMEKNQLRFFVNKNGKPPLPPRQKDMKLTVCRDIRKGPKTTKRKIALQDQVALRV